MPVIVNPPTIDFSLSPNNIFVVALDYWKDVVSGDPVGTSNGTRIAEQARDADLAACATPEHAQETYNMVLGQASPAVLYPPEKQSQLLFQALFATAFVGAVGIYIYKKVL